MWKQATTIHSSMLRFKIQAVLKNGPFPVSFSFIFGRFKNHYNFSHNRKKIKIIHKGSMHHRDLNSQPIGHHSPPWTTRPGLQAVFAALVSTMTWLPFLFIRTKRSERAKRAHSVLREVEKMGYKNFPPYPYRVVGWFVLYGVCVSVRLDVCVSVCLC